MTARCMPSASGGSATGDHDGESEVRDACITPGVHKDILLSFREYQAGQRDIDEIPTGFKSPWITPREWR